MMTMLVATLGLLPAALSHAIGSDSQRPFAIVIVGGLIATLVISVSCCPRSMSGWPAKATCCRRPNLKCKKFYGWSAPGWGIRVG